MVRLATGVDLVDIERFREVVERHGDRFLLRVFTPQELDEVGANTTSLAARFAAKEAVAKALGTGIGAISWREIEILRGPAAPAAAVFAWGSCPPGGGARACSIGRSA